jgi:hypothetical protein
MHLRGWIAMDDYKATDIAFIKKQLGKIGPQREKEFMACLSCEEMQYFEQASTITWLPSEMAFKISGKALPFIYPAPKANYRQFGHDLVHEDFGGIYKDLIRATTVNFIVVSMQRFWPIFNRKGKGTGKLIPEEKKAILTVENYPDMPDQYLELLLGYFRGLFEMIGEKDVSTTLDASDRQALKFLITWES